jgi:hypothetical protein
MNDAKRDYIIADRQATLYNADRFKFKVFDIVSNYEKEMTEDELVDGLEYKIVISHQQEEETYIFKNKFPKDILRLENLIGEVLGEICYEK